MPSSVSPPASVARLELANRIFFRLYQCANMLHKTGTRAVAADGLTTQQWAVMGALSRAKAAPGMAVNELARYLMVSRQNLSGVLKRMEAAGHLQIVPDSRDRRSRIVQITAAGRAVWAGSAQPKIAAYYEQALEDFSLSDMSHTLHYFMKLLDNMQEIDAAQGGGDDEPGQAPQGEGA
ncbi:MarR family winged helix-turn-helix transcriptional regulator [Acidocella sp.]|uniref:MarR family winged helix-turn-helix transcriptional regulator n=1 Tax=Acidocella sp. TaxID=50710 RepID=UPI00260A6D8D|nr:MarR family transcriptional regulator [Acidocella sp.]